ncbi:MAG: hypothetical protein P4L27_11130 [Ignavibacteriaceae bacterium]|nr:hypothetical protein [Ignavibacteriaceae bacterium]
MINYSEIEKLLIETLEKESPESLREWLNSKKREEAFADLGEGDYQTLETEFGEFCYNANTTQGEILTFSIGEYNYTLAA